MEQIVIDARMINSSGIGRYLQDILPEIIKRFRNVILLGDEALLKEKLNQVNLSVIPFDKSIYSVSEQLKYPNIIPECDIFFSPHYNAPLLSIKAKYRIVTIHDVFHLAFYKKLSISQKIYAKLVIANALHRSDTIITVSEFSKKEILKYTNSKYVNKIEVIHNGVKFNREQLKTDIHPCDNKPYFLYVGNVKPHKNLARTVGAFKLLLSDYEGNQQEKPYFIIVGKKEGFITEDNNIVNIINNDLLLQKHVKFTGWATDEELNNLYINAMALIFPSYYEGFGYPPLEAMGLGTPVIASTAASIPEVCGDAALYFDPFDIMDIYTKMKRIITDELLRNNLIARGINNVKRFAKDLSINSHIQLFEKFLNN
ncbi:MAG: glycosyltransferase family 4 protein [Bacteroidales bacterium]|jgi:glycosyltransferase involved in cell wall biosynthesis|nr:glycosyltransferase family 4 protein [Bacteroidales bacterium]